MVLLTLTAQVEQRNGDNRQWLATKAIVHLRVTERIVQFVGICEMGRSRVWKVGNNSSIWCNWLESGSWWSQWICIFLQKFDLDDHHCNHFADIQFGEWLAGNLEGHDAQQSLIIVNFSEKIDVAQSILWKQKPNHQTATLMKKFLGSV